MSAADLTAWSAPEPDPAVLLDDVRDFIARFVAFPSQAALHAVTLWAHTPRLSRVSNPASTRTFRWCDTVGWDNPSGATRSHTHASAPSCAATRDSSRSRAGSAIALSVRASRTAACGVMASPVTGVQQTADSRSERLVGVGMGRV